MPGTLVPTRYAFDAAESNARLELRFPGAGKDAPLAFLSLRAAGTMTFSWELPNPARAAFFGSMEIAPGSVLAIELLHSRDMVFAESPADIVAGTGSDGVITRNRRLVPAITVADCMPIWIHDPVSGAFGVLHSGWKGTGILGSAAALLRERFGTNPESLYVIFGPCIGSCCYRVDWERADFFRNAFGNRAVVESAQGPKLDLLGANLGIAERLGIERLAYVDACTSCDPRFGSYRREGPDDFTRMVAGARCPG